ncbi:DUF6252 family protein [Hymenobacter sp. J193]|uniref:DUF6252 family protein n=1 Tax=Hymenobacter sp. J193 TaxID=2898429 RepID=UPI002151E5FF|nr:DUF6252 family protein [Hymenobacter sp. J193]MCR5887904.1 DUF6252 family protein [Hymenobacter sp. J193]
MKQLIYLAICASVLTAACKKEELDALPKATQEGKNTAGCLIDGQAFVATGWPSGGILGPSAIPPLTGGFAFDTLFYVKLYGQYKGENATVMLFIRGRKTGTYLLNRPTLYYPQGDPQYIFNHATFSLSHSMGEVYVTDTHNTGKVDLTYLTKPVSSGTFEFTAASTLDPRKTITITHGRFDRKQ